MKTRILFCGVLLLYSLLLSAQELKVESFTKLERDLLARTSQRLDRNDVPCAVVRISVANANSFTFSGNIIGEVIYNPGEAIVYLTDRTRKLRINSDKFGSMEYEFPERIVQNVTYRLSLSLVVPESKKTRTLVMPVLGIGETLSYGAMLGVVKKWGGYVKVKSNFEGKTTEWECDDNACIPGTSDKLWLTGNKNSSRFSVTGGALYRIALPLYLYLGGGYGYKRLAWETMDGSWAKASEHSYEGIEGELGLICRIKNFAFSGGVQTTQFKYWEATVGVAIMF